MPSSYINIEVFKKLEIWQNIVKCFFQSILMCSTLPGDKHRHAM